MEFIMKNYYKIFIFIVIILLISACNEDSNSASEDYRIMVNICRDSASTYLDVDVYNNSISCDNATVIVNGETLVRNGQLTKIDEKELLKEVGEVTRESWLNMPRWHWDKKTAEQICEASFEDWE